MRVHYLHYERTSNDLTGFHRLQSSLSTKPTGKQLTKLHISSYPASFPGHLSTWEQGYLVSSSWRKGFAEIENEPACAAWIYWAILISKNGGWGGGGGGTGNDSRLGWLYFYFVEVKL